MIIQDITEEGEADSCRSVVILDSGSDVSLLPLSYATDKASHSNVRLQDCQGSQLKTVGLQEATLVAYDSVTGEEIEPRHNFVVGDVNNCILSLGELYKAGWTIEQHGPNPMLTSPDQQARNSFAIEATVCRVLNVVIDEATCEVRAVIRLSPTYITEMPYGHWDVSNNHPHMRTVGVHYADPRAVWSANFAYRSTMIQKVVDPNEGWQVVEVSQRFLEKDDPFSRVEEIRRDEQYVILTILADREENLSTFGMLIDGEEVVMPEFPIMSPSFVPGGQEETLFIGEMQLAERSSVKDLREAAKYLKLSTSGSKSKLFNRIRDSYELALKRRALEVARQDYARLNPEPRFVDAPAQPSEREREKVT